MAPRGVIGPLRGPISGTRSRDGRLGSDQERLKVKGHLTVPGISHRYKAIYLEIKEHLDRERGRDNFHLQLSADALEAERLRLSE